MAEQSLRRLYYKKQEIVQKIEWSSLPRADLISEFRLGTWGGSEVFAADINQDGYPELLWLQSMGVFKSELYLDSQRFGTRYAFLADEGLDLFCLTATTIDGEVLWQYGTSFTGDHPYPSHAATRMVCFHDIDGDGALEILALTQDTLVVLEGSTGELKATRVLPADNFGIVTCIQNSPVPGDVTILISVMAESYDPFEYGNPTLFLNSNLEVIHQGQYKGAGHIIPFFDADLDGCQEVLLGYQLVKLDGRILWTVDCWEDRPFDAKEQHVDHAEVFNHEDEWHIVIAGSDRLYCVNAQGQTVWDKVLPHPQYCLVGRLSTDDPKPQIFVTNCREVMNGFDLGGDEIWRRQLPEHWPMGRPKLLGTRPLHKVVPATLWKHPLPGGIDMVIYSEGGWPYGVDGHGKPALIFPHTPTARKPVHQNFVLKLKPNNYGISYNVLTCDVDGDGIEEVLIHDRRFAWIYKVPN